MIPEKQYDPRFFEAQMSGAVASARRILGLVWQARQFQSVVDVGAGAGGWARTAVELGAQRVVAIDGPWTRKYYSDASIEFREVDLRNEAPGSGRFDLAICVEVLEHLPEARGLELVKWLAESADVILFSAAIPLQGGVGHINEQWPDYWCGAFERYGMSPLDIVRPSVWEDPHVEMWYAQNCMVFTNEKSRTKFQFAERSAMPARLVHPRSWLSRSSFYENASAATLIKLAIKRAIAGRIL